MLLQKSHHNPIGYNISFAEHIENAWNSIKLFTVKKKIITKTRGLQGNNYVGIMSSIDDLSIFIKKKTCYCILLLISTALTILVPYYYIL